MRKWSNERAWAWYNALPWLRGFNYVPSNAINRRDQWQEYGFIEKMEVTRRELTMARDVGFNAIRSIIPFDVWYYDHDGFMERLDEFLALTGELGYRVMIGFISDGERPLKDPPFGPVEPDWGYHGGNRPNKENVPRGEAYPSLVDEPGMDDKFCEYVREIITKYARDERVLLWNIWNEPGNSNRAEKTMPVMLKAFEAARECLADQPLAADVWRVKRDLAQELPEIERVALELSDVISFHDYGCYDHSVMVLEYLKQFDRPLLLTEWLNRISGNAIDSHLPLYYLERVAVFNWGLVAGKAQYYEPWNGIWDSIAREGAAGRDVRLWQHDLFRPSLHPYDPAEIAKLKMYFEYADKRFEREHMIT